MTITRVEQRKNWKSELKGNAIKTLGALEFDCNLVTNVVNIMSYDRDSNSLLLVKILELFWAQQGFNWVKPIMGMWLVWNGIEIR